MGERAPLDMTSYWVDQQRQTELITTAAVLSTLAGIFVTLRCVSRFYLIRNPGPDDFLIILAMLLTLGYTFTLGIVGKAVHIGFPMTLLSLAELVTFMKMTLAIQVMYYANIFCIKTSILFTYLRFAVSHRFRMLCIGTIVLHAVFFFICLVITLAQCQPLAKMWDFVGAVDGKCINTTAFFYFTSGFNILTDVWIIGLPIKTLMSINRPKHEKVALLCVFGVGSFACIASIIRLHTIYTYTLATDPIRDGILVNLWSVIEVTVAIACASVSAMKPVFSREQRHRSREASGGSKTGSSSRSRGVRLGSKSSNLTGSNDTHLSDRYSLEAAAPCPPTAPLPPLQEIPSRTTTRTTQDEDRWNNAPSDESGMIVFTPLSAPDKRLSRPPLRQDNGGMSSSGSMLPIQK